MKIEGLDPLRGQTSFSRLSCVAQCPERARLKYVEKVKPDPSDMDMTCLLAGRAVHGGQEYDAVQMIAGRRPGSEEVLEAATAVYQDEEKKDGVAGKVDEWRKEHAAQLTAWEKGGHRARMLPYRGSVEAAFRVVVPMEEGGPVTLEGYTDVVIEDAGRLVVVDHKTSGRGLPLDSASGHLQLCLEQVGAAAEGRTLANWIGGSRQKPTARLLEVAWDDRGPERAIRWVADVMRAWRGMLKAGVFPRCSPTASWCSASWCEYYRRCYPEVGQERTQVVVTPVGSLPPEMWRASLVGRSINDKGELSLAAMKGVSQ